MVDRSHVRAWRPPVAGVDEIFHARFTDHVYPMHTHATWALLIVDEGVVRYDLDRHEHGALSRVVTLLPPHVAHNGRANTQHGFHKRVLYLDSSQLTEDLVGLAVDNPTLNDSALRRRVHQLHRALERPEDALEAESRLALVSERLRDHLHRRVGSRSPVQDPELAHRLRDLLNAGFVAGVGLQDAAAALHAHPAHLVRVFSNTFGMGPHQYLTGRRVDLARRLLLEGMAPGRVAAETGFYDQAHLNRHFQRMLGTSPGRYAHSGPMPRDEGRRD